MDKRAQTGSIIELKVIGSLIERGYNVYSPVVSQDHVDCVIETTGGFKKIQIKIARRKHKQWQNYYASVTQLRSKANYGDLGIDFIICEGDGRFFIIPKDQFIHKKYDIPINIYEGAWHFLPQPSKRMEENKEEANLRLYAIK